jgi:hypothetical protein
MINFLQTRLLFTIVVCLAIAIFAGLKFADVFTGNTYDDVWIFSRYVFGIPAALAVVIYGAWRIIPILQRMTFPYLGGRWTGVLRYGPPDRQELRDATLTIRHHMSGMSLVLETRESTSTTLAVVATRDPTGTQYHVYYVFENRRKAEYTKPGLPTIYRGVAIMSVGMSGRKTLSGEYFTDQPTNGIAEFKLERHAWF